MGKGDHEVVDEVSPCTSTISLDHTRSRGTLIYFFTPFWSKIPVAQRKGMGDEGNDAVILCLPSLGKGDHEVVDEVSPCTSNISLDRAGLAKHPDAESVSGQTVHVFRRPGSAHLLWLG